jgi:hypothetical protein
MLCALLALVVMTWAPVAVLAQPVAPGGMI